MNTLLTLTLPFGASHIDFGQGLPQLAEKLRNERCIILTDERLAELYAEELEGREHLLLPRGEAAKTFEQISRTAEELIRRGADRSTHLIAFGGGAICDFTGFLAATYKRGIPFSYMPTTLLAQVDAALGGKNGINLGKYKNMLGRFSAPEYIFIQPTYTFTQEREEWVCGLAETVKHAAVADADFFGWLEKNAENIMRQEPALIDELVRRSAQIKLDIVQRDPLEQGERKKLNFGHTLGHALELHTGLRHGEAVALGIPAELTLSEAEAGFLPAEKKRISDLLEAFQLPVKMPTLKGNWLETIGADKKRTRDKIDLILLEKIGRSRVEPMSLQALYAFYNEL